MSFMGTMKNRFATPEADQAQDDAGAGTKSAPSKPKPIDMPYAGLLLEDQDPLDYGLNAGRRVGETALSGWHMLLAGLTGSGKGRRCLYANVVMWGNQSVIFMSTKGEDVAWTIRKRAQRGPVYVLDLGEEIKESHVQGIDVTRVVSDPCKLVHSDDEAVGMADLLIATKDVGTPSGGSKSGGSDSTWEGMASRPLAALIRAGGEIPHLKTGQPIDGGGIQWALDALDHPPKKTKPGEAPPADEEDYVTPNWGNAYLRAKTLGSRHAEALRAVMDMEQRQRDSVAMTMRNALRAWSLDVVAGDKDAEAFEPAMLEKPGATLYIVSPGDGSAASAACAVIEQSIRWWRKGVDRNLPTLGLFLDELCQSAPLPKLPEMVSLLRGYNIRLVAAVQGTKQLRRRYGDAAEELLETFPSILVLPGTPAKEALELAAWFAGEDERVTTSTDHGGRGTRSVDRVERVTSSELLPRKPGTGRLLIGGQPGVLVSLPDIEATDLLD
ncbi:type IV secretory system conjugative DNA transfer family protein [Rothia halotolerans]|uniref:type IV secretory system conjugative DNA transfer family protein n=1 Tax=Rothia halotolerans TaxID=405770 RepID=UPI00101DE0AA|nr:type IV secretory system conjugative DNA transfer family protein [Rothia halotolerans]